MRLKKASRKRYDVIYADPPWEYRNQKTGGNHTSGAAQQYDTMSLSELKALPLEKIAERDSMLFLWTTTPFIQEALEVTKAWGFKYIGMITWHKLSSRPAMGYWLRVETEHLIYAKRGAVKAWRSIQSNHVELPVLSHSEKPEEFRQLIESLCPDQRYLEMFARREVPNWDAWGNEAPHSINLFK